MMETICFIAIIVVEIILLELHSHSLCVVTLDEDVFAEGSERKTPNGLRYCAYTGIPYATPPIERNRFELPMKIPLWKGSSSNLMPVLFWIHGGSFNIGSGDSDLNKPDYILEKEIVVVTINYRLGPFGFLSYGNVTRNVGLHDQRMALEWIHENIINFGGNKSGITLSGWSSGGASVSYHIYANKSKDLFDKAIMMSGNMLNPWAFESDVIPCTNELLNQLSIRHSTYAIEELKTIYAYDLIPPTFSDEMKIIFFGSEQFCFVPTLDDEFVMRPPHINSDQQYPANVSILIGTTDLESEWAMSFESTNFRYPNTNLNISNGINRFMSQIFEHYSDFMDVDRFIRNFQRTSDMSYGIYKFIKNYVDSTKQENVFVYRFAFDDKFGELKENTVNIGAVHGDELKYLFKDNVLEDDVTRHSTLNEVMMQQMVTMWSNFIKFGNPTSVDDANNFLNHMNWPPFSIENRLLLNIDYDMTVVQLSDNNAAFQLWDSIYQCLYYVQCDELNEYLFKNKTIEL